MNDIHALSGAYAVDALDDIERAYFARHLEQCSECQGEVAGLRAAAAMLSETTAVAPPAAMRDRVLADIRSVRPLPPLSAPLSAPESQTAPEPLTAREHPGALEHRPATVTPLAPRRRALRGLAAAAAAVVLVGTGATVAWQTANDNDSSRVQPSATQRVLQAPDAERVTRKIGDGAKATLVRSKSMNQAVLLAENMPAPPDGKVYELWLQDAEKGMQPAGLMPDGASTVLLSGDAAEAVGAGITVEPPGGSHVPTSDPVALFSFENA